VQVLDLEGMAGHRGSLLGSMPGGQPSQRAFESAIACALARLDPMRPVMIEAESSKIGDRIIPPMLWAAMKDAPRIEVHAPLPARAAYLVDAYADIIADTEELSRRLAILRRFRGAETVARWQAMLGAGDHIGLARALMADHYDPTYSASRGKHDPQILQQFKTDDLGADGRAALAAEITAWLAAI
ncbi:MAG: tRNA 2-selenouridine(34) synthase MnmH, partial [Octadecabacter sp.]|nr:tRNA 2-selenouridine(34) synthase MnmH [Octadecabacter sp.]